MCDNCMAGACSCRVFLWISEDLRGRHARIGRAVLFWVGTIEDCSAMVVLGIGIIPKFPHFTLTLPYR